MKRSSKRSRRLLVDLVAQRARALYSIAVAEAEKGNYGYASQLGGLIRELAQYNSVRLPRELKRGLCKRCGLPLIPGVTARVRLRRQGRFSYIVIRCGGCGWIHRVPYKRGVVHGEREEEG